MPLPLPELDTRTWQEIVDEARAQIPRYAPEWTDYNASDPGVTLFELFAWLSEILIFRTDRVPPAELRAFLRWFGVEPLPAQAAQTVLALRLPPGSSATPAPGGLKVADPQSGLVFEADAPLLVSPAWIELGPPESTQRGQIWTQAGDTVTNVTEDNARPGLAFEALGPAPAAGDALWLGFDVAPAAPGQVLSLYVWTATWATDAAVVQALLAEQAERGCPPAPRSWPTAQDCRDARPDVRARARSRAATALQRRAPHGRPGTAASGSHSTWSPTTPARSP